MLEHDADDAKASGLIPAWTTHFRAGLDDPAGSLPTQTSLRFCD